MPDTLPPSPLTEVSLFAGFDETALAELAEAAEERTYAAGAPLVREGDPGDELLVIRSGTARVVVGGRPRRDLGPGDALGEIALLDGGRRSATVYAVDDCTVLAIDGATFRGLLEADPGRYPVVVRNLCTRLRGLESDRWAAEEESRLRELQELFLQNVGHELRTPLTSALGFLQIATSRDLEPDKLRDVLDTTLRGLRGLHGLVEDVIAVGDRGRQDQELAIDRYPVSVLVDGALADAGLDPGEVRRDVPVEVVVDVDGAGVRRILAALLDNARKFGPTGGAIGVRAAVVAGRVEIDVVDEGDGLPLEDHEAVFALFHQRDPTSTRAAGGLGVGLALARSTARAHGGDLRLVEDAPTTTFRLTLPYADRAGGHPPGVGDDQAPRSSTSAPTV